jgi:hypothetical protein
MDSRGAFPMERSACRMILPFSGLLRCLCGYRNCAQSRGNRRQEEGPRLSYPESRKHMQSLRTRVLFGRLAAGWCGFLRVCTALQAAKGGVSEQQSELWMERRRGLDQEGTESSAGWPKAGWAFTQNRQCTHVRDTNAYICNIAVQSRQVRATLRRSLLYQRCCCPGRRTAADRPVQRCFNPGRRTVADRPVNFWTRPAGDFRAGCFRHHRALRTAALHGVHRLRAEDHAGERRHCRKNDEQCSNEFGESSHA